MNMQFKSTREAGHHTRFIWLTIAAAIAVLLFYEFFLRNYFIPLYVNTFYKGPVHSRFVETYVNLNQEFKPLGFNFDKITATCYNGISDSGNALYHRLRETVLCSSQSTSNYIVPSQDFISKWGMTAPKLVTTLQSEGWKQTYNYSAPTSLRSLYAKEIEQSYSRMQSYQKIFGKYTCTLDIDYSNLSDKSLINNIAKTHVSEACRRYVSFFGGYKG